MQLRPQSLFELTLLRHQLQVKMARHVSGVPLSEQQLADCSKQWLALGLDDYELSVVRHSSYPGRQAGLGHCRSGAPRPSVGF